jgi:hypothetical protein
MPRRRASPEQRYETLVARFAGEADVTHDDRTATARSFGVGALKTKGKIFAMLVRGALVLKLPRLRVDALVDAGTATRFDAGKGTPMKEWAVLDDSHSDADWLELAREARAFVG